MANENGQEKREPVTDSHSVGNAAAMREALDAALRFIGNLEIEPYSPLDEAASELRQRIMDALAAPPRQCDVGTAEEQAERFNFQCFRYHTGRCSPHCSTIPAKTESECVLKWAQMPYEAKEGAGE